MALYFVDRLETLESRPTYTFNGVVSSICTLLYIVCHIAFISTPQLQPHSQVRDHYAGLGALLAYWARHADADGLTTFGGLGDWVTPDWPTNPTPTGAVSSFYVCLAQRYMVLFASVLGLEADVAMWTSKADACAKAYHKRWCEPSFICHAVFSHIHSGCERESFRYISLCGVLHHLGCYSNSFYSFDQV